MRAYTIINGTNGLETKYQTLREALRQYDHKQLDTLTQVYKEEEYYYNHGKWISEDLRDLQVEKYLNKELIK